MKHLALPQITSALALVTFMSCSSDVEDFYVHERAFFRFTPVSAMHPLHAALNNMGEFCQITIGTRTYNFKGVNGTTSSYPITALEAYGKPECIAGFVVGTPSTPDLNMKVYPIAYDLVCPTCYENNMVQRSLNFSNPGEMACTRCHCTYSLATGLLLQGDENSVRKLYRYRMSYTPSTDMMLIMN